MATKRTAFEQQSDAIALLRADHAKVKKMFREFERLHEDEADDEAEAMARRICTELKIHTAVEEEIFYPAVRAAIDGGQLLDEAEIEHASAKDLISQIESEGPGDDKYAAKVMVLGEYVDHHVEEEQSEMFPKARKAKLDMDELGRSILERKQQLKAELGIEDDSEEDEPVRTSRAKRVA
jgi:hypothetical protein